MRFNLNEIVVWGVFLSHRSPGIMSMEMKNINVQLARAFLSKCAFHEAEHFALVILIFFRCHQTEKMSISK